MKVAAGLEPSHAYLKRIWVWDVTAAALLYAGVVACVMLPVTLTMQDRLLGDGADAFLYVWGTWWYGLASSSGPGASVYDCPLILHPYGANLIQHDLPIWPNMLASLLRQMGLNLVGAYNLSAIVAIWLNALAMFLLAHLVLREESGSDSRFTKRVLPALAAGVVFACAPYFWSRCRGHLTLLHAYPLPLLALCLHRARMTGRALWQLAAGCALVMAALCNYYYFVYGALYAVLFHLYHAFAPTFQVRRRPTPHKVLSIVLFVLGALSFALAIWIGATGGGDIRMLGTRIIMRGTANPLIAWWLSWLLILFFNCEVRMHANPAPGWTARSLWRQLRWTLPPLVLLFPILLRALPVLWGGEFAEQRLSWKGGPSGAYPLASILPNIYHRLWGDGLRGWLSDWDLLEGLSTGLGLCALLVVLATRSWRGSGWWGFAFLSGVMLSLGPFLRIWPGFETGPILPFWLIRYVPIVSGARIPGRWIAAALVPWAILVARGLRRDMPEWTRIGCVLVIAFELVSFPAWSVPTTIPAIYRDIAKDSTSAAVMELPFGIRDGRRCWGSPFPPELLYYQTLHRHPVTGGYLSRVPDRVFDLYRAEPVISALVRLQEGQYAALGREAFEDLCRTWRVGWVVLDEARASPALKHTVYAVLGKPEASVDLRALFRVRPPVQDKR